jgi:hypothetical protein
VAAAPPPGASARDDDAVGRFRAAVSASSGMLGASLTQAASVALEDGAIRIAYPPALDGIRKVVEREENLATLRRCALGSFGRPLEVRIEAAAAAVRAEPPTEAPPATAAPAAPPRPKATVAQPPPAPAARDDSSSLLERARSEPAIRKLLSEFGAQVIEIRPLEAVRPPESAADGPEETP